MAEPGEVMEADVAESTGATAPIEATSGMGNVLLGVAAAVGVILIVLGIASPTKALHFPDQIAAGSETEQSLRRQLVRIERAARTGDLPALRRLVSTRYLNALEARLSELGGGGLTKMALHEQFGFVGDVSTLPALRCSGSGRRAVLVLQGPGLEAGEARLHAYLFDAGHGQVALDGKRVRAAPVGATPGELGGAASALCVEWLEAKPGDR